MKNKNAKGGVGMYFESKSKGGIESDKVSKDEQYKRYQSYMCKFNEAKSRKTKGGNN